MTKKRRRQWSWSELFDVPDLEGLLAVVAVGVALVLGWAVVELVVPALFLAAYVILIGALRRVAHDDHGCEGRLGRAALWGVAWATVYTAPLVALVWIARAMISRR